MFLLCPWHKGTRQLDVNVTISMINSLKTQVSLPAPYPTSPPFQPLIVLNLNNHHLYKSVLKILWQVTVSTSMSLWTTKKNIYIVHSSFDLFSLSNAITGLLFFVASYQHSRIFNNVEVVQRHKYSRIQYSKKYKIKLI